MPKIKNGHRQLVNHFPHINCLTNKIGLIRNLRDYYSSCGYSLFSITPPTYLITDSASISVV